MYQNIFQRHLRRGEQRTFSNLEAKEYLIHSGTFEFALIEEFFVLNLDLKFRSYYLYHPYIEYSYEMIDPIYPAGRTKFRF